MFTVCLRLKKLPRAATCIGSHWIDFRPSQGWHFWLHFHSPTLGYLNKVGNGWEMMGIWENLDPRWIQFVEPGF